MPKPENVIPHKWKKGESGNPKGRPRKLPELNKLLADVLGEEKDGVTAAEAILKALRAKAARGDIRAAEVLLDRGYGKPTQKVDANIKVENPVFKGIDLGTPENNEGITSASQT
jgi:hypothetical protein